MNKFAFLLGDWNLQYLIPESSFSEATTGRGFGSFKRELNDKFLFFDYTSNINNKLVKAHGIFTWDTKSDIYRYWWFESSGSFMKASCYFTDDETLNMNWHDSILVQSFKKLDHDKVQLKMSQQNVQGGFDLILEVIFTRKL